ncbi:hypothetical protein [Dyella sp.]|uniref:hypothetical protein n=1 Tax=Dyella sp. TaxID=1869338 RepID=UPI0028404F82|nr:hypothetical protein [Dyella sp.]MDR3445975.1 hypothetical protein [Dyella sp.]
MAFVDPVVPNLADFITFCQAQGVSAAYLPPSSDYYQWALDHAVNTVYTVTCIPAAEYVIACYNFGMHWLVCNAPDVTRLAISSLTWSAGAAIAVAAATLGFAVGEAVDITVGAVLPLGYNGCFSAQVMSGTSFAYPLATNPGTVTNEGVFGFTFFASLRKQYQILSLVAGPVQTATDQGTSTTLAVADFFKTLTIGDLDLMKTPWGQRYLAYAQKAGPTVVGVS